MKRILLILFLFSFNARASICGTLLTVLFELAPKKEKAELSNIAFKQEEFCDTSKSEPMANFDILLLTKEGSIVNKKTIYIPTMTIVEESKSDKKMLLGNSETILDAPQFRTLKFSIKNKEQIKSYKIILKKNSKVFGEGVIQ